MKFWIKKQIEILLNWCGFISKSQLLIEQEKYDKKSTNWFEKPEITPTRERNKGEVWDDYWQEHYEPFYNAWYLRSISLYPEILKSLLFQIATYDWDYIVNYMKKTDWFWDDRKRTPNKEDLILTVISLTHSCIDYDFDGENHGGVETGGFKVLIKNKKVVISFDKSLY